MNVFVVVLVEVLMGREEEAVYSEQTTGYTLNVFLSFFPRTNHSTEHTRSRP